jgi:hypothetical protein
MPTVLSKALDAKKNKKQKKTALYLYLLFTYLSGQLVHGQKGHADASSVNIFVQAYFCPSKLQASSKYSKIF